MKKMILLLLVFVFLINCDDDNSPPNYSVSLNVPYYAWIGQNYCTVACIQMWGAYDGVYVDQATIASDVGAPTNPYDAAHGVDLYTHSIGFVEMEEAISESKQDLCIAYSIACVDDTVPSIIPFNSGLHAILANGFDWHPETDGRPIADYMRYHDPDPNYGPNLEIPGSYLKSQFTPANGMYYVVTGMRLYGDWGLSGYAAFLMKNGTYYGGPALYNPSTN
jgi:hypothetical protein